MKVVNNKIENNEGTPNLPSPKSFIAKTCLTIYELFILKIDILDMIKLRCAI